MTVKEAIKMLTDEAEKQGADANDEQGIVRAIVAANGLSFNAWFCVCCELADMLEHKTAITLAEELAMIDGSGAEPAPRTVAYHLRKAYLKQHSKK